MIIIEDTIFSVSVLAEPNISIFDAYLMLPVIIGDCFNKRYFLDNFQILFQSRRKCENILREIKFFIGSKRIREN